MKTLFSTFACILALTSITGCEQGGSMAITPSQFHAPLAAAQAARHLRLWGPGVRAACPSAKPESAQCFALVRTGPQRVADGGSGPSGGFTPSQIQQAYNLPSATKGAGQLIAIVDAFDNPKIASDLAFFRSYFGLPVANFTKYNQMGQTGNYPSGDTSWGIEEDLDVEMASVSCPNCTIALIEANSGGTSDLEAAEAEAVTLGAHIVSNSWGCYTPCGEDQSYFEAPGVEYLIASGDDGYGTGLGYPNSWGTTISVGGTALYVDAKAKRGYRETAWLGTNSGCAATFTKPPWQGDPGCAGRMGNDIAALADPATGPAFYDTFGFGGWLIGGGTSTAAPLIAGVFGLAGNASSQNAAQAFWEKANEKPADLNAITKGSNGTCSPAYFCTDGTHEYRGYGGPTGWGSPNGIGAF